MRSTQARTTRRHPQRTGVLSVLAIAMITTFAGQAGAAGRLVVLPSSDLAWGKADLRTTDALILEELGQLGFETVDPATLLDFLTRHRIRYTGGVTSSIRSFMGQELDAEAVLIVSVGLYETEPPPRVGLQGRIVSVRSGEILWADEIALAGEEKPGPLGRRTIDDPVRLLARAVSELLATIAESPFAVDAVEPAQPVWDHPPSRKALRPKRVYRAPEFDDPRERPARLAVLPFENDAKDPDAGDVVAGLFLTNLAGRASFDVIEWGEVRDKLLEGRVIQVGGLSLAQADFLRETLDADLAVTGRVVQYAEFGAGTVPRVTFSVWVLDLRRRTVVWSGLCASRGDDGVVFFGAGRVHTARALAGGMVGSAADALSEVKPPRASSKGR